VNDQEPQNQDKRRSPSNFRIRKKVKKAIKTVTTDPQEEFKELFGKISNNSHLRISEVLKLSERNMHQATVAELSNLHKMSDYSHRKETRKSLNIQDDGILEKFIDLNSGK